jgi:very-short-patch-repair endonuclease
MQISPRSAAARERLLSYLRSEGGVVRSATAVRIGHSPHVIAAAVEAGMLTRVRRRWVALPDADPHVVSAARAGVVVSCITQARRLGLWVLDRVGPAHVAADLHAGRVSVAPGTRVHRDAPLVPRHPDALVDPTENVLAIVARCQPFESALAIWESAMRQGLVQPASFARLPLATGARRLLEAARPFADSGLETFVPLRLRFLKLRIVAQVWIAGHHVDFLIGERLVLQIDGGHHVGRQRTSDIRHDAQLMLLGYHVIRVGYEQVIDDWPSVQHDIMRAIAQGLHRRA